MELDFYFPDFNIAIEFNGDQHYFATDLSSDPSQQRKRDGRKKYLCRERGVKLITLKAIDLIAQRLLRKFKRELPLNSKISTRNIDADAKKYRITLKENFNSPTAHKSKGLARQKTVAKLFEKHPPCRVHVFSRRLSISRDGRPLDSGGMIPFAWFVWRRDYVGAPSLHWL